MRFILTIALLLSLLLSACTGRNGTVDNGSSAVSQPEQLPEAEIFRAGLPMDGSFSPTRVPAVSSLSLAGADFEEASSGVGINAESAQFSAAGDIEYAIWRFAGTPQDSVGLVNIAISSAQPGTELSVGISDYASGRWDWLGSAAGGANFEADAAGSPGQHSSPAGFIYVALVATPGSDFSADTVTIEYLLRHDLSGYVTDLAGNPLQGALVTTNLSDPQQVFSGADGSFELNGIPDGNWAVMATLAGWVQPLDGLQVTVSGGDLDNVEIRLVPQTWGFSGQDPHEPNNELENAFHVPGSLISGGYISALDDRIDNIGFDIPAEGWYYLEMRSAETVLFPLIQLYLDQRHAAARSSDILSGANWVGYYFPEAGSYIAQITCEAGGGSYELELISGETSKLSGKLADSGLPGDGGDGQEEELANTVIELDVDGTLCQLLSFSNGAFEHDYIPPQQVQITPRHPHHSFNPTDFSYDFAADDLLDLDFNITTIAPIDPAEPNDTFGEATVLSLPLTAPVEGWLGGKDATGDDYVDWYRFNVQEGRHVYARVQFPGHDLADPDDVGFMALQTSGEVSLGMESAVSETGNAIRSRDPLPAGVYYLMVFYNGDLRNYALDVFDFEARTLTAQISLKDQPLDHGEIHWRSIDGVFADNLDIEADSVEIGLPLYDGEQILLSYQAFGLQFSPSSHWVEINGDTLAAAAADYDDDALESNDGHDTAAVLEGLPQEIIATLSEETDTLDYYLLTGMDTAPLVFTLQTDDPDNRVSLQLESADGTYTYRGNDLRDGQNFYAPVVGGLDYELRLSASGGDGAYSLTIAKSEKELYRIHGTLDHGKPGESYGELYVLNHTTGSLVRLFSPDYDLGYYPVGSYQIEMFVANHDVSPAGKVSVELIDKDEQVDFTASYNNHDFGEPNNSRATATPVSLPLDINASTDFADINAAGGNDLNDYYAVQPAADGVLQVTLKTWRDEPLIVYMRIIDDASGTVLAHGRIVDSDGTQLMRLPVVAGHEYAVLVSSSSDLEYNLNMLID
ncbi:carboxypeptidase regulatory-like domain-containing protein [bacterium]|nr:carboxypeptidase regulatory-like domain-containing protein [bacterium]